MKQTIQPPFPGSVLTIPSGLTVTLVELVQQYPGKRFIFRGLLANGSCVAVKLYAGTLGQTWEWWKGVRGAEALARTEIAAPRLLYSGYSNETKTWMSLLEWIAPDDDWPPHTAALEPGEHMRFIRTIASHHQAGITQGDTNWNNFVPRDGLLYVVDTDRIRSHNAPLNRRQSLRHLVRIYSSKSKIPEDQVGWAYRVYIQQRGWRFFEKEERRFLSKIAKSRVRHAAAVSRRSLNGWKHYAQTALGGVEILYDRRSASSVDIAEMVQGFRESAVSTTSLSLDGRSFNVKPCTGQPESRRPLADVLLLGRKAISRNWVTALTLRRLGFPIERPVALLKDRKREMGWLVTDVSNAIPLRSSLPGSRQEGNDAALSAIRNLLALMRRHGIVNTRWSLDTLGWDGERIWLLDIAGIDFHPAYLPGFDRRWTRGLDQLADSLAAHLGASAGNVRLSLDPSAA